MPPGLEALRAAPVLARQMRAAALSLRSGRTSLDEPRPPMPPGHVEEVPGAGDVFYRDTGRPRGRSRGTVLLLHGWMVPSDPHWFRTFPLLRERGYRVVALDARGHGRGLRIDHPFRLEECADDAAALVEHLGCGPVLVAGYSMGGLIAQLLARRHPETVAGMVLGATACELRESPLLRLVWSGMGLWQWYLRLAPRWTWDVVAHATFGGDHDTTAWAVGELRRGAAWDIAEAGREIGRFDSRPWVADLPQPAAVLMTLRDFLVPPGRQAELARLIDAPVIEIDSDHLAPATTPRRFHRALVKALELVERRPARRAVSPPPRRAVAS